MLMIHSGGWLSFDNNRDEISPSDANCFNTREHGDLGATAQFQRINLRAWSSSFLLCGDRVIPVSTFDYHELTSSLLHCLRTCCLVGWVAY